MATDTWNPFTPNLPDRVQYVEHWVLFPGYV
jgi:hypothetical protein